MANYQDTLNPSAQLAPVFDGAGPPTPGRRRLLALAAGTAAITTTAAAETVEVEPLECLWREQVRLGAMYRQQCDAEVAAEEIAEANYPPRPRILYARKYGTEEHIELNGLMIKRWLKEAKRLGIGHAVHEQQLRAWNEWRAACATVDAAHGLPQIETRSAALLAELYSIEDAILEAPARSMRGVLVKLRLLAELEEFASDDMAQNFPARMVLGLIADLEAAI
jgi:hypothetical protein